MSKPFSRLHQVMAVIAAMIEAGTPKAVAFAKTAYTSRGHGKGKVSKTYHSRGRHYPERSLRQENWSYRRAQGGPGLDAHNQPRG